MLSKILNKLKRKKKAEGIYPNQFNNLTIEKSKEDPNLIYINEYKVWVITTPVKSAYYYQK